MTPILDKRGKLLTKVVTHFPPGAGLLILRGENDELEIQLVDMNQANSLYSIGVHADALGDRSKEGKFHHEESVGKSDKEDITGTHLGTVSSDGHANAKARLLRVAGKVGHKALRVDSSGMEINPGIGAKPEPKKGGAA